VGVCHAKRVEYVSLNVNIEGLTCDLLDQRAKQDEVDIGVTETLTGTRLQRCRERTVNAFRFISSVQSPHISQIDIPRCRG